MLNLMLVGFGENDKIKELLSSVRKQLQVFFDEFQTNIYNLDTLYKAESNLDLLKKRGRLSFSTLKDDVEKEYWGTINCKDYNSLYLKWFGNLGREKRSGNLYYSKINLKKVLIEMRDEKDEEDAIYDFMIRYKYGISSQKKKCYSIIEWRIDEKTKKITPKDILGRFNKIISILDENFPGVFMSAYITNVSTELSISHLNLYEQFDLDNLDERILGIEYSTYIGKNICAQNKNTENLNLSNFFVDTLKNGVQYTSRDNPLDFDEKLRESALPFFESVLIPAYSIHEWSQLSNLRKKYDQLPQMVHVYTDDFSPLDPLIVFSFGMEHDYLDNCLKMKNAKLLKRFSIKEFLENTD